MSNPDTENQPPNGDDTVNNPPDGTDGVPEDEEAPVRPANMHVPTIEEALGVREGETYYAWSPIRFSAERDNEGNFLRHRTLKIGAEVSASRLGIDDEEFQALVRSGAVRTYPYPDDMPEGYQGSPVSWLKQKTRMIEQQAENLSSGLSLAREFGTGARR